MKPRRYSPSVVQFLLVVLATTVRTPFVSAQGTDTTALASTLKKLSLEELMNIEVISVAKRPQPLSTTASAIQVITAEDIERSGATSLPQALRLATNLQVSQANASQWAISARGFNNVLADKLLVLIDGRTVYTPLYAGVSWDVQNPPLESIARIEVISGPGGALWGANAVNGVINIITKTAADTKGMLVEASAGGQVDRSGTVQYGGALASNLHARVYGSEFGLADTRVDSNGALSNDGWQMAQAGFRADWNRSSSDLGTLQSDWYDGRPNPDGTTPVIAKGGNILGRWSHTDPNATSYHVQLYYDRAYRDFRNGFTEDLNTYDADVQGSHRLGSVQQIVAGLSYRLMDHRTENLPLFAFTPAHRRLRRYGGFLQDEISFAKDRVHLTLGTKVEHNAYTGTEISPSMRLAWVPKERTTIWGAISRAVRTPARIDRDFYLSLTPTIPLISGDSLIAENVVAFELGSHLPVGKRASVSISTFYNLYDDLRSAEPGPPPLGVPITFHNGVEGHEVGVEFSGLFEVNPNWHLRGGYTFLKKKLNVKPGSQDLNGATAESDDPEHQFLIQSTLDITRRFQADAVIRFVGDLPKPVVPEYVGLDIHLAWKVGRHLGLSLVGQNLLEDRHVEFIPTSPSGRVIERSVYGKITWR